MATKKALILIDVQNDYFEGGKFALWNTNTILENILKAIEKAKKENIIVIIVQHIANSSLGTAPFFNKDTKGAENHEQLIAAVPDAPIVIKEYADSFHQTNLESILSQNSINELLICGMMTQNCVTHTAISKAAEKYKVNVLIDCCTTVSEILHHIALHAISVRVNLVQSNQILS
eukprot:TRINITY_DN564_c1_g1_i1.p1 TRINITY_DN564_c1_g1~~TRINITY_DN564_c1_g1_i1.p1  ORF type:complete len:175 (+),score=82.07 TRINITY_DN564_c1_g1_i1:22-546(+)